MKLVTFKDPEGEARAGWLAGDGVVDMQRAHEALPSDMLSFIDGHEVYFKIIDQMGEVAPHYLPGEVELLAPLPNPRSFRDYIGFEQHMLNASASFGHQVGDAWYEIPIFYFTNHQAVSGPEAEIRRPAAETKMDLELEMGVASA